MVTAKKDKKKDKKNKDKKDKKTKQPFQQPLQQPMFMMMPQAAPPPQQPVAAESSSSSSDSSSDDGANDVKQLHRGVTVLLRMPRKRLQALVEALDYQFDGPFTADMSVEDMCRIVWLVTRVKPSAHLVIVHK